MKKITKKYQLSVEGETEILYFQYLQNLINECSARKFNVSIVPRKYKSPQKYVKSLTVPKNGKQTNYLVLFHIFDFESHDSVHQNEFKKTLDEIKEINEKRTSTYKQIKNYIVGYSNFTFELWMILHKKDGSPVNERKLYLAQINAAFGTRHRYIQDYKKEKNFNDILNKIELIDVIEAVNRGERIRKNKINDGETISTYKDFQYYKNNPDLTIHEVVKKILCEAGVIV